MRCCFKIASASIIWSHNLIDEGIILIILQDVFKVDASDPDIGDTLSFRLDSPSSFFSLGEATGLSCQFVIAFLAGSRKLSF